MMKVGIKPSFDVNVALQIYLELPERTRTYNQVAKYLSEQMGKTISGNAVSKALRRHKLIENGVGGKKYDV